MSEQEIRALLRRVECGATTARDAALLARLIGVEWVEQLEMPWLDLD